jgi:SSS family solute:Na+ symporter
MMAIKISLVLIFFAVMLAIGFYCRRHTTDVNGFVLGGRSVGPWLTAFAYGTSYFSAVVFVGYAGQFGWKYGISATWAGIGNALLGSFLAWTVLGRRTRIMTQHLNSATMPDFFGKRFDSDALKIAASVITFVFMIPYTASLYNGLSRLFGMAFHIDFVQGLVMLFGIVAVIAAVLISKGGFMAALDKMARVSDPAISKTPGVFASFFGPDPLNLLGVVLLTSLGTWGLPQMVQKFYAIKSEKAIDTGTVVSTVFALVVAGGCYFLGGFGRLFAGQADVLKNGYDTIVPTMISGLPDILIGIVIVLVLSASMSTLSALVLTSSSTITLDLIRGQSKKHFTDDTLVAFMRGLIVVFIAISVVIALIQYHSNVTFIAQLMGISWGAMAGAFLAPFLYGLYWKGTTAAGCWASFIFAVAFMLADLFAGTHLPTLLQSPINAGAFCMIAGLVIVPAVSIFTKKPDPDKIDATFACYGKKVLVEQREALSDSEKSE